MLLHEVGNVGGNRRVMTHVDRLRRPRADRGWIALARSLEHRDDELGGQRAVGTVGWRLWPGDSGLEVRNVIAKRSSCRRLRAHDTSVLPAKTLEGQAVFLGRPSIEYAGEIAVVTPHKQWRFAGHPYLSGEIASTRLDVTALGLLPLRLDDCGVWNPDEENWGETDEPIAEWVKPIIARTHEPHRRRFKCSSRPARGLTTAEREELTRLRKEVAFSRRSARSLEKAAAFFAKQSR